MKIKNSSIFILVLFILSITLFLSAQCCDKNKPEPQCDTCTVVYKPNIYFFPKQAIQLDVKLEFPLGGEVIKSEPKYQSGWNVKIDASGLIDDQYDYLFYESFQPDVWQHEQGWCIKQENLKGFFETNLAEYGFGEKEINDFTDYWIPKLNKSNFYFIYPQTKIIIDKAIKLSISIKPDHILRLYYVIKESKEPDSTIKAPVIEEFSREGFYITEWGVIL
jgi:hypothetical protein